MSTNSTAPAVHRSRPNHRKRLADDAAYTGAGLKRSVVPTVAVVAPLDPVLDAAPRPKRKRVEVALAAPPAAPVAFYGMGPNLSPRKTDKLGEDASVDAPMVNFATLPTPVLHDYLTHFDVTPQVFPSPLTEYDPPAPCSLLLPAPSRDSTPAPITPANRPRRDPHARRRASSRLSDDAGVPRRRFKTPLLSDVHDFHAVLAGVAQSHFGAYRVSENDTFAAFNAAVRRRERSRAIETLSY